jgi:hypothetical protein
VVRSRAVIFGDFLSSYWQSVNYLVPCDTKDVLFSFSQMFLSSFFFAERVCYRFLKGYVETCLLFYIICCLDINVYVYRSTLNEMLNNK